MEANMVILHIVKTENCKANGVSAAIDGYIRFESLNNEVAVLNVDGYENVSANVYNYSSYKSIKNLPIPFNKPDLIIFNEVYKIEYIKLYKECLKNNIKYVIIPHGCLVSEAQSRKKIKKILGNYFLFNEFIKHATAIQFLNEKERHDTINFNYTKSIVSGNGIDTNITIQNKRKKNNLIFIGRYSIYHKGLDLIINLVKEHKDFFLENKIKVELYGCDSVNTLDEIYNIVKDNNLEDIILVNPPVYGEKKIELICESYCFIQLSRFEGEPMGLIESLAYGLPCIITKGTNLSQFVEESGCGYSSEIDITAIFNNIKKMFLNVNERDKMSDRAIKCVKDKYDWRNVIKKLEEEYKGL